MMPDRPGDLMVLAAVDSALATLDGPAPPVDVPRIERYLTTTLILNQHLSPAGAASCTDIKAACRHLRRGDLLEGYLALHAARAALDQAAR